MNHSVCIEWTSAALIIQSSFAIKADAEPFDHYPNRKIINREDMILLDNGKYVLPDEKEVCLEQLSRVWAQVNHTKRC